MLVKSLSEDILILILISSISITLRYSLEGDVATYGIMYNYVLYGHCVFVLFTERACIGGYSVCEY